MPRHSIRARFQGLLVDAVMRIGRERRALAGLEVHDVVAHVAVGADGAAAERLAGLMGFASSARLTPKLRLAASVPAMDWKIRSTGAPAASAAICVVTWASTQLCTGIWKRWRRASSSRSKRAVTATLSPAGLMPMTASPEPSSSPSRMEAAMPVGSSVG